MMVKFISSWAEQVILAVIVATILEMILPNGKSKKYIKMVIGIYILFYMISPFVNTSQVISSSNFDLEDYMNTDIKTEAIDQASMDKRLEELYIEEIEKEVTKTVEEKGFSVKKCKVDAEIFDKENGGIKKIELLLGSKKNNISQIENININIENDVNSQSSDIDSEDIKNLKQSLAEFYQISYDIIIIK